MNVPLSVADVTIHVATIFSSPVASSNLKSSNSDSSTTSCTSNTAALVLTLFLAALAGQFFIK